MYLPGIFTTSDIINCKIFVAFQASSICCIRVSPWCFSGANLCNCDIAISNLPIISQLQSQSQMGHPPPHLYYPRQFHAPPAPWLSSLFATIISRSSLWNSTSVSIDACAPCCPYPPPPSHRASLPSPSSLLLLMRVSSRCSVSSAAGSSVCSYFAELHVYSHTKKNCQDYYNSDCSPRDFDHVYYDMQDTEGSSAWNMQASFSHPNLHSSIVCILLRWDPFIHTMSSNVYIISLTHRFCSVFLVTLD